MSHIEIQIFKHHSITRYSINAALKIVHFDVYSSTMFYSIIQHSNIPNLQTLKLVAPNFETQHSIRSSKIQISIYEEKKVENSIK